jgi:hypothetical protein
MKAFFQNFQLIDGLIGLGIVVYFIIYWLTSLLAGDRGKPTKDLLEERKFAATTVLEICKTGITVAGFIFPILVGFLSLSLQQETTFRPEDIHNILAILFWVGTSLVVGLLNMTRFPGLVNTTIPKTQGNNQTDNFFILTFDWKTGFLLMFQVLALIGAVIRSIYLIISQLE